MKKILLFGAAIFLAVSCAESGNEDVTQYPDPVVDEGGLTQIIGGDLSISVSIAGASSDSRVSVDTSGDVWDATWDTTDGLVAYYGPADGTGFTNYSTLTMSQYDPEESVFTGTASTLNGYKRRLAYYPEGGYAYIYDSATQALWVDSTLALQEEGIEHSYMLNEAFVVVEDATVAAPESMKHATAAVDLRMRFTNLDADVVCYLTKVEVLNIANTAYIKLDGDVTDDDLYAETTEGTIAISFDQKVAKTYESSEDQLSVKFNVYAFSVAAGDSVSVQLTFAGESGSTYTMVKEIKNSTDSAVSFPVGTYNYWNCICDLSDFVGATEEKPGADIEDLGEGSTMGGDAEGEGGVEDFGEGDTLGDDAEGEGGVEDFSEGDSFGSFDEDEDEEGVEDFGKGDDFGSY